MEDKAEKNRALVAELEDGEWRAGGVGGKQVSEIMFCFFVCFSFPCFPRFQTQLRVCQLRLIGNGSEEEE